MSGDAHPRSQRIVSLDFCADQFVLEFVDRDRIAAVSPDATKSFSYKREAARNLRTVRPTAEDVLALQPDLIVRSYGGGPNAEAFFERAGIRVVNVGWAEDIAGALAITAELAAALGEAGRGRELTAAAQNRLDAAAFAEGPHTILYMTAGGVTTGPGSFVHSLLTQAGYTNYETAPGWRAIPLERIAATPPEFVAAGFFETPDLHLSAWSAARHPIARKALASSRTVRLDGAWTGCGGWFAVEAVEALSSVRTEVPAAK